MKKKALFTILLVVAILATTGFGLCTNLYDNNYNYGYNYNYDYHTPGPHGRM